MHAQLLRIAPGRLDFASSPDPTPGQGQLLLQIRACGVCRTDLHLIDGELPDPSLPIIPGHEIVGTVLQTGPGVTGFSKGDRVGVPWLGWTCGACAWCRSGRENPDVSRVSGARNDLVRPGRIRRPASVSDVPGARHRPDRALSDVQRRG